MTDTAPPSTGTQWRNRVIRTEEVPPDQLLANPKNYRIHPRYQQQALASSIREIGFIHPIIAQDKTDLVLDGHLRITLALRDGVETVTVNYVDLTDDEAMYALATIDPIAALAEMDASAHEALLADLRDFNPEWEEHVSFIAHAAAEEIDRLLPGAPTETAEPIAPASLADRFVVPPFSVLDARQGYWQERKRQWLTLGIRSEIGRAGTGSGNTFGSGGPGTLDETRKAWRKGEAIGEINSYTSEDRYRDHPNNHRHRGRESGDRKFNRSLEDLSPEEKKARRKGEGGLTLDNPSGRDPDFYAQKRRVEARLGHQISTAEFEAFHYVNEQTGGGLSETGTSIFDPVLCELVYRWFSPPGSRVLDPFAGGSVRGIVAAKLGRSYTGIDLSTAQVAANREQAETILSSGEPVPDWIEGDSYEILGPDSALHDGPEIGEESYDLIFSCPPYGNLEVYSDDPADLSTMDVEQFTRTYTEIIARACEKLREDRFAAFVVGDYRTAWGTYAGLINMTVDAFAEAGLGLYNEAILVTSLGSLPVRVGRQFAGGRKLGKTHQNVLVFVKGDWGRAVEACGPVEIADDFLGTSGVDLPSESD